MLALSARTSRSLTMFQQAKKVIPGGVSANIKYFDPHPIIMEKAKAAHLFDVDGNEYVDYLLCYGALILGHGHPKVTDAVMAQIFDSGSAVFGAPHLIEMKMAEKLVELFPSMDMVRFTNSGLEATLLALRLAEAYTGKKKIAKFEGHYHGGYDQVLFSVNPSFAACGDIRRPNSIPESKGIPSYYVENTIILPFNDLEATEILLRKHKDELAAVILEPVQGGFIPAEEAFLHGLRKITKELSIILILDEVKTGFRLTLGGAQSIYEVEPDLTALGKVLGGGFPIGAVGGKKEIMEQMDPNRGKDILAVGDQSNEKNDVLFHSGTYNGHPTVLAAGLATISVLEEPFVMDELLKKTVKLRTELEEIYRNYRIPMQTLGAGSIFNLVLTDEKVNNYRDLQKADMKLRKKIDYELLNFGVYTKPLNRYSMSTVHTDEDIQFTIEAHEKAIKLVKGL